MTMTMKRSKIDPAHTRAVMALLDGAVKKYGLPAVRHAAAKWTDAQRERARLIKRKAELERGLAAVASVLRGRGRR